MYRDEYKVSMHWILVVNIMLLPLTGSVEGLFLSSVSEPLRPISLPAGLAEVGPDGGFKCLLEEFLQRLHETIYVWFLVHSRYSMPVRFFPLALSCLPLVLALLSGLLQSQICAGYSCNLRRGLVRTREVLKTQRICFRWRKLRPLLQEDDFGYV